jgi:perosamine synthetase
MIPVSEPFISEESKLNLKKCVESGWITQGKYTEEFENEWARFCGRKYGVAVSNGTVALEVALNAAGIGLEDEVIMPTFTIISCLLAVIRNGATPVFIDADLDTFCMSVDAIECKINEHTKAIMVAHMYGNMTEMAKVEELADKYDLLIIEDAAEAHGAKYKGRMAGSFGDISCFSFYANKLVTCGEGGMILTDDEYIYQKSKSLRSLCFGEEIRFLHDDIGYNFRITDMQSAIGLGNIPHLCDIIDKRKELRRKYYERLERYDIKFQRIYPWVSPSFWMIAIVLSKGIDTCAVMENMNAKGIQVRPFFYPMHLQHAWMKEEKGLQCSERLAESGIYLPSSVSKDFEIDYITESLIEVIGEKI